MSEPAEFHWEARFGRIREGLLLSCDETLVRKSAYDALAAKLARARELWAMAENVKSTLNSAVSMTWVEWMDACLSDADHVCPVHGEPGASHTRAKCTCSSPADAVTRNEYDRFLD